MNNYKVIDHTPIGCMVDVAMVTYNHANFITEAIESFLMQKTTFPIKLVIAEDCSTDETRKIILNYQEQYPDKIKLILQDKNVGAQQNNQNLFQNLDAKYIAALEGDDYWTDPLKLQKQVDFLEANEDYVICSGKAQVLENEKLENVIGNVGEFYINNFYVNNNLITCTSLFRNCPINNLRFKNVYFGDWMLYLNILDYYKGKKAIALDEVYSVYRVNPNGAMARLNEIKSLEKHFIQIREINNFFSVKYDKKQIDIIKKNASELYVYYLKNKSYKKAFDIFLTSIKLMGKETPFRLFLSYFRYRNKLS